MDVPANSIFSSPIHIYFQCCAVWWKSFHLPARKRKQKGLTVSDFALLLVIFNSHHGSKGQLNCTSTVSSLAGMTQFCEADSHLALLGGCKCCSPPSFAVAASSSAFVLCKLLKKSSFVSLLKLSETFRIGPMVHWPTPDVLLSKKKKQEKE